MKVGFIGLGAMGLPMAANLARAGLLAGAWNRSPSRAEALASEAGAKAYSDPESLAADCDVVVLCVSADADVMELVARIAPVLRPGTIVADCSTVSSTTARRAADSPGLRKSTCGSNRWPCAWTSSRASMAQASA